MKKFLTSALVTALALTLYNCAGDDTEALGPANKTFDTLQPGDSVTGDTFDYPGADTIAQDSIYFPVDSIPGDTIIVVEPYPGGPETPTDSIYFPSDSSVAGKLHTQKYFIKPLVRKKP